MHTYSTSVVSLCGRVLLTRLGGILGVASGLREQCTFSGINKASIATDVAGAPLGSSAPSKHSIPGAISFSSLSSDVNEVAYCPPSLIKKRAAAAEVRKVKQGFKDAAVKVRKQKK